MEVSGKKLREQFEGLKSQKMLLQGERARADQLEEETKLIRKKVENFKGVELALRGQEGDLNQFLHERGAFDARTKDLANLVILLKQKLVAVKVERSKAETQVKTVESRQGNEKAKVRALEAQVADLQAVARNLSRDLETAKEENVALGQQLKAGNLRCVDGFSPSPAGGFGEEDMEERPARQSGSGVVRVTTPVSGMPSDAPGVSPQCWSPTAENFTRHQLSHVSHT